jgi:hypothetical protein
MHLLQGHGGLAAEVLTEVVSNFELPTEAQGQEPDAWDSGSKKDKTRGR